MARHAISDSELVRMYRAARANALAAAYKSPARYSFDETVAVLFGRAIEAKLPNGPLADMAIKQLRDCVAALNVTMGCVKESEPAQIEVTTSDAEMLLWRIGDRQEKA